MKNIRIGKEVKLKTGLEMTIIGECNIVENNQLTKKLVGKFENSVYVNNTLCSYHLFGLYDIEGVDAECVQVE